MKVLSGAQFEAWKALSLAPVEEVREGIWAVPLPLPIKGLPWVFSYFILDSAGDLHVVDTGWNSADSWTSFTSALTRLSIPIESIRTITVTHFHPDHLGMAARIRDASGASVALLSTEQQTLDDINSTDAFEAEHEASMRRWGVPPELWPALHAPSAVGADFPEFHADIELADGDILAIPGRTVQVLSTPGHTAGELSLFDPDAGILYSGDHLLPNQFPGIGLGGTPLTNPIADYFASLDKIGALETDDESDQIEVNPGHGYRFTGVRDRIETTRTHHLARSTEIAGILERGGAPSVWEVASRVFWTAGWDNLVPTERISALRQTALHIDYLAGQH